MRGKEGHGHESSILITTTNNAMNIIEKGRGIEMTGVIVRRMIVEEKMMTEEVNMMTKEVIGAVGKMNGGAKMMTDVVETMIVEARKKINTTKATRNRTDLDHVITSERVKK